MMAPRARCPKPTTMPTAAAAKMVAAVVTPEMILPAPWKTTPPPMKPMPVTMPAIACGEE